MLGKHSALWATASVPVLSNQGTLVSLGQASSFPVPYHSGALTGNGGRASVLKVACQMLVAGKTPSFLFIGRGAAAGAQLEPVRGSRFLIAIEQDTGLKEPCYSLISDATLQNPVNQIKPHNP